MKTCLVVDDSKVIRMVARKILEELNFTVIEAEDGRKALDACKARLPEGVLLDWNMPVMDGIEFLKELRALPGGDQVALEIVRLAQCLARARFGDVVRCPHAERAKGNFRIPLGQRRRHDDHKPLLRLDKFRQGGQAIHVRHLDVEKHEIDVLSFERLQGERSIPNGCHDADVVAAFEHTRE